MNVPFPTRWLLEQLETQGFEAYAVGGCVRDMLLGLAPQDWDLCTNATPQQIMACFPGQKQVLTGVIHGTVGVIVDGQLHEITTYRLETEYSDGRHPDAVTFVRDLHADLARRDFTVNAMAYHPHKGLVDLWNGQQDLKNRCLRCVGNPRERFEEDALRILRGLRFGATYGFSLHPKTADAAIDCREGLGHISAQRIGTELKKLLLGTDAPRMIQGFPEIFSAALSLTNPPMDWQKAARRIAGLPLDLPLRLAVLLSEREREAKAVLERLCFDKKTIRAVVLLLTRPSQMADPISVKQLLRQVGPDMAKRVFWYQGAMQENPEKTRAGCQQIQEILEQESCYQLSQLAVDGVDLMRLGIQGNRIGKCLEYLLNRVQENPEENEKRILLKLASRWETG